MDGCGLSVVLRLKGKQLSVVIGAKMVPPILVLCSEFTKKNQQSVSQSHNVRHVGTTRE